MSPDTNPRSPWIDDELEMLGDQVGRFLEREMAPQAERWDRDGLVDRAAWAKAGEAGILCASVPTQYGGGGGTRAHEAVIIQEIARAGLGGGFGVGNTISSGSSRIISWPTATRIRSSAGCRRWRAASGSARSR